MLHNIKQRITKFANLYAEVTPLHSLLDKVLEQLTNSRPNVTNYVAQADPHTW